MATYLLGGDYSNGQAADADQPFLLISDPNVPDVGCAAEMNGRAFTVYPTRGCRPNVIGIYFEAYSPLGGWVAEAKKRGDAAQGFGQYDRSAAVQNAEWLVGTFIHWHTGCNVLIGSFQELDTKVTNN